MRKVIDICAADAFYLEIWFSSPPGAPRQRQI